MKKKTEEGTWYSNVFMIFIMFKILDGEWESEFF